MCFSGSDCLAVAVWSKCCCAVLKPRTQSSYCFIKCHPWYVHSSFIPDACMVIERDTDMSKNLGHLNLTEYPLCTYNDCHRSYWSAESQPWGSSEAHTGMYTGVICDLGWSLVDVVLLHWSCHSHSQSISQFQKDAWRHAGRKGAWLYGNKTSIPSSQSQSTEMLNDAGCLQRRARWKWVKEDPMSHLLPWYLRPSIIIIDMSATEFCRSPLNGNFSK